jgi:hypothetical protein
MARDRVRLTRQMDCIALASFTHTHTQVALDPSPAGRAATLRGLPLEEPRWQTPSGTISRYPILSCAAAPRGSAKCVCDPPWRTVPLSIPPFHPVKRTLQVHNRRYINPLRRSSRVSFHPSGSPASPGFSHPTTYLVTGFLRQGRRSSGRGCLSGSDKPSSLQRPQCRLRLGVRGVTAGRVTKAGQPASRNSFLSIASVPGDCLRRRG